jgi:hypothetical protein
MGEITVYFIGICTHMQWPEELGGRPRFLHRVVLVNGVEPRLINERPIPGHHATLRIAADDLVVARTHAQASEDEIITWKLSGTTIEIANATGKLSYDASYECCIPHLKALTPDLPPPSTSVVVDAQPHEASCYFEVNAGLMRAGLVASGAAVAVLTVTTKDDFPILRLSGFSGGEPQDIVLRSGARIAVSNVAQTHYDEDNDFLLHYKTAEYIPANARVPIEAARCCTPLPQERVIDPQMDVGPGCSNSNFP